ncbi:uncharacterized protein LOC111243903 isoform X1 [Varroa destructor]|uniref:Ig-like domain-containing protein n=1 Tax=Varroa destructor TaxID=109461 RepID=A0A7M7J3T2_VARDE|nr:uncharacterized protein LOC111243903 isoform X1 [Varroa destructor]
MWWWPGNGLATIRISWKCAFGRNTFVETILLLVLVSCGRVTRSWAAILYLSVPRTINVDQINEAILDCQYDYSHNLDDFLVVKWFLNDNEQPIYTWLPHSNSRAFHPLYETFIDKTYTFSAESYEIYRGIRFSHLHPNLTGIYLCSVSSKWGHFEERKPMTLYSELLIDYL